jgi:Rrf2 family protein
MISQSAEYALRAVVWLAGHAEETLSTPEIARRTMVPAGYLSKVLQALARAGLVASTPGRAGGFVLTRPSNRISVLDVINAVGRLPRIERCPLGIETHGCQLCPLHQRLDDVAAHAERVFGDTTMADVLKSNESGGALCETVPCPV